MGAGVEPTRLVWLTQKALWLNLFIRKLRPLYQQKTKKIVMKLYRPANLPTSRPPDDNFTGDVFIQTYFRREAPSRMVGAIATFAPGARTPWKVNPFGQTVIVTSGTGWAQSEGEQIVEIRTGDMIWFPPGQKHWEGATPDQTMTYVAIQEEGDGQGIRFPRKVTDQEYGRGPVSTNRLN